MRADGRHATGRWLLGLGLILAAAAASGGGDGPLEKIGFDVGALDDRGLYGPPDGLRAFHYEFCIPHREDAAARVRAIDASVRLHRSPGRIGCRADQLLAIGSTHQPGYRGVLRALAGLPFVHRIEPAVFE